MLTKVKAFSYGNAVPQLELSDLGVQGDFIHVTGVEGLGPVAATINTTPYGSMDGEAYSGASVPARNIVLTLELNPNWSNWTMEELRRFLYRYFMSKQPVRLVFESDDDFPEVRIDGYTETVDPTIFSKDQEIQVSIVCPDPYFYATSPEVISGDFEDNTSAEINYVGSVETGVQIAFRNVYYPTPVDLLVYLGNTDLLSSIFLTKYQGATGQYLEIGSIAGNKHVRIVQEFTGAVINRLRDVQPNSTWPLLKPGINNLVVSVNQPLVVVDVPPSWELIYTPKFGGL